VPVFKKDISAGGCFKSIFKTTKTVSMPMAHLQEVIKLIVCTMLVYTIIDKDIHNQTNVDGTAMNTIDLIVFIKEQHNW